ncbi:MAG: hypothetical protein ACPG61_19435, partial [Paracoccaceae bacterium]
MTHDPDTVEAVARAISQHFHKPHELLLSMARAALSAMPAATAPDATAIRNAALREAAAQLRERMDQLVKDEGSYEWDTNVTNLPEWAETAWEECETQHDAILALIGQPARVSEMPTRIQAWHSESGSMSHIGTWATTRYPAEAVSYVREDRQPAPDR